MIELRKLQQIVAVARAQSYAKAAKRLNITQPALSRCVQLVEQELGLRLFDRGRAGVFPTESGKRFVAQAEELLRQAETLKQNFILEGKGLSGELCIGFGSAAADLLLPWLLTAMAESRPLVSVRAVIDDPARLADLLNQTEIEFFVSDNFSVAPNSRFNSRALCELTLSFYVNSRHPLLKKGKISHDDIAAYPLMYGNRAKISMDAEIKSDVSWSRPSILCDSIAVLRHVARQTDNILLTSNIKNESDRSNSGLQKLNVDHLVSTMDHALMATTLEGRSLSPLASSALDMLSARNVR